MVLHGLLTRGVCVLHDSKGTGTEAKVAPKAESC